MIFGVNIHHSISKKQIALDTTQFKETFSDSSIFTGVAAVCLNMFYPDLRIMLFPTGLEHLHLLDTGAGHGNPPDAALINTNFPLLLP